MTEPLIQPLGGVSTSPLIEPLGEREPLINPIPNPGVLSTSSTISDSLIQPLPESKESDILGAIGRGVQTSLAPMTVDEKELSKDRTTGETVAEGVANIATDIASTVAATAGASAVAGSVVPGIGTTGAALVGGAVGLGLGIYRALGYEELMSRAEGRSFDPTKAAVNVAVEVIPGLKLGGKVVKGASMGVLGFTQALQYGADPTAAAVVGGFGGGLTALATKGKPKLTPAQKKEQATALTALIADPTMSPKQIDELNDFLGADDNTFRLLDRVLDMEKRDHKELTTLMKLGETHDLFTAAASPKKMNELAASLKAEDLGIDNSILENFRKIYGDRAEQMAIRRKIEGEVQHLARGVLRAPVGKRIRANELLEAKQQLSAEGTTFNQAFVLSRQKRYLDKAVLEVRKEATKDGEIIKDGFFVSNPFARALSDPMFPAREVDRLTGLNLEGAVNEVSFALNRHSGFQVELLKDTHTLRAQAKKHNILHQVADYLDGSRSVDDLTTQQKEVVEGFRSILDKTYKYAKDNGIDIDYRKNYFPSQRMGTADAVKAFRNRLQELGSRAVSDSEEALEFRSALGNAAGIDVTDEADIRRAFKLIEDSGKLKSSIGFTAGAAFRNEGKIPTWLQDRDVGKVIQRYVANTTKSVNLSPVIRKLELQVSALDGLGMDKSADFYRKYIKRLSGQPGEKIAWFDAKRAKIQIEMDKILEGPEYSRLQKKLASLTRSTPDFLSWMGAQIYTNYLGFAPKAVIRNLTQSNFMTAPEIGGVYGQKTITKAILSSGKDKLKLVDMEKFLQERGYAPGKYIGEGYDLVNNSLRSSMIGPIVGSVERIGELAMWAYGKSDVINRYWTVKASDTVFGDVVSALKKKGQDLTSDEIAATKFVRKMNPGVRGEFRRALQSGNPEQAREVLTKFLLSKTQFNYGPQALHELGQEWGRLFSMFTKWPSAVVSDMTEMAMTGRKMDLAKKYMAPLLLMAAVNEWADIDKNDSRLKALVGANLVSWAPAASMAVSMPPWLNTVSEVVSMGFDALQGDLNSADKAGRKFKKLLEPYTPGGVIFRATDTATNLIKDKKGPFQ